MRILKWSLFVLLPALLAGYVAWQIIPCQPLRSIPVPAGTKLLEFSPGGRYVVTFDPKSNRLALWPTGSGEEAFATEISHEIRNESTNWPQAFYGFSSGDHFLAVATIDRKLLIVDLDSRNVQTSVAKLAASVGRCVPRPGFSSDGRYLSYFIQDVSLKENAVLYDIAAKQEHLRIPDAFEMLGTPTPDGKWFLSVGPNYEIWNIHEKKRLCEFPRKATLAPSAPKSNLNLTDMATGGQPFIELHFVKSASSPHGIFFYRFDWTTGTCKSDWQYLFPSAAVPCWNIFTSDPMQYLLIKTEDEEGNLVQDLLEVNSGKVVYRYSPPIDMLEDISSSYEGQKTTYGAGLTHSLGRTGEFAIDSRRQVIASKRLITEPVWWRQAGRILSPLGFKPPPWALDLQFHSVSTGKLLERVPLHTPLANPREKFDPVIAMHPTDALVAIIDQEGESTRLLFWQAPPSKSWGWIVLCSMGAGAVGLILQWAWTRRRLQASTRDSTKN
jgi:hypothetical protein